MVARELHRRGWVVDSIVTPSCPWLGEPSFNGESILAEIGSDDARIEQALLQHRWDLVSLHGDRQVQWLHDRWERLPSDLLSHFPPRESLTTAISKVHSLELADELGLPVLPTRCCTRIEEVKRVALELAGPDGEVVIKGEGSSAGSAVRAYRVGRKIPESDWSALTGTSSSVLVQRRIRGPRVLATVLYENGSERSACVHEKLCTWPNGFGVTAMGRTRHVETVHAYARQLFERLRWHGPANVEFRQSIKDGKWYFIEINPRVPSSIGIQSRAGQDLVARWAQIAEGRGAELGPSQDYRSGIFFWWTIPMLALTLRHPGSVTWKALISSLRQGDWSAMSNRARVHALKTALWCALQPERS